MNTNKNIINEVKESEVWIEGVSQVSEKSNAIEKLKCISCRELNAWINLKAAIKYLACNHKSKCNYKTPLTDIFPNLDKFKQPKSNSMSKEEWHQYGLDYLAFRGLKKSIEGLDFACKYSGQDRSPVIEFKIDESTTCIKIIHPKHPNSYRFEGSPSNKIWINQNIDYKGSKEIFVVEGIINALSLIEKGINAVAILSASFTPTKDIFKKYGIDVNTIVLAFDRDNAGIEASIKWYNLFNCKGVLPLKNNMDWNDDLIANKLLSLSKVRERHNKVFNLAVAKTPEDYFKVKNMPYLTFFQFDNKIYQVKRDSKNENMVAIVAISNFSFNVNYFIRGEYLSGEEYTEYHLTFTPSVGKPIDLTLTSKELKSNSAFKEKMINHKLSWLGKTSPFDWIVGAIIEAKNKPDVRKLKYTGYDKDTDSHVYEKFAVTTQGKFLKIPKEGYYKMGHNNFLKSDKRASLSPSNNKFDVGLLEDLLEAYGGKALTAISFMVASLFCPTIKKKLLFFPFMSFYGEPGSGKSTLGTFLQWMQCQVNSGLELSNANTFIGEIRTVAKYSGMMLPILEAEKADFNKGNSIFAMIKPLYDYLSNLQTKSNTNPS